MHVCVFVCVCVCVCVCVHVCVRMCECKVTEAASNYIIHISLQLHLCEACPELRALEVGEEEIEEGFGGGGCVTGGGIPIGNFQMLFVFVFVLKINS